MSFLAGERLWLLLAVLGIGVAYVVQLRRRSAYAVRFPNLPLLTTVAPRRPGWRRHLPAAALLLALAATTVAFARPSMQMRVPVDRATIVIAIDTSESMRATDIAPDRMTAAKSAAQAFVDQLPRRFHV